MFFILVVVKILTVYNNNDLNIKKKQDFLNNINSLNYKFYSAIRKYKIHIHNNVVTFIYNKLYT